MSDFLFERGEWVRHNGRFAMVEVSSNGQVMVHIRYDDGFREFSYVPYIELERVASKEAARYDPGAMK